MDIDNNDNTATYTAVIFGVGFLIIGFAVMLPTVTNQADAESEQTSGTSNVIESLQDLGPDITASSPVDTNDDSDIGTTSSQKNESDTDNEKSSSEVSGVSEGSREQTQQSSSNSDINTSDDNHRPDASTTVQTDTSRGFDNPRQLRGDTDLANQISNEDKLFGSEAYITDYSFTGRGGLSERKSRSVASISFSVNDGDVLTDRIDVSFVPVGDDGDDKPWAVFETITIKSGRTTIASTSISQKQDWVNSGSDYNGPLSGDKHFRVRANELDYIVEQNDTGRLSIHLTAQDNVADAGDNVRWGVFVDDNGIQAVDAAGVRLTFGDDTDTATFTIREGPDPDTLLNVSRSYADPDSSAIDVFARKRSDAYSIFAFNIKTKDVDVTLDTITLQTEIKGGQNSNATFNKVIDSTTVAIKDNIFTLDNVQSVPSFGSKNVYELTFNTDGVTIDNYNSQTVQLLARFNQAAGNYTDGTIVRGSVRRSGILSIDGLANSSELPGSWHQLRRSESDQ